MEKMEMILKSGLFLMFVSTFTMGSEIKKDYNYNYKIENKNFKKNNIIIRRKYLTVNYSCKKMIPNYVEYSANRKEVEMKNLKRLGRFYEDEIVNEKCNKRVKVSFFKNKSKFDRGHLASNSLFNFNKESQKETFYISNIAPQKARFNRILWRKVEENEIMLIKIFDKVNIVTGVCGEIGKLKSNVSIPKYFYKILFFNNQEVLIYGENKEKTKINYISKDYRIRKWINTNCDYKLNLEKYKVEKSLNTKHTETPKMFR